MMVVHQGVLVEAWNRHCRHPDEPAPPHAIFSKHHKCGSQFGLRAALPHHFIPDRTSACAKLRACRLGLDPQCRHDTHGISDPKTLLEFSHSRLNDILPDPFAVLNIPN